MDFTSYTDEVVLTAAALVNHLTPGTDGTRPYEVPDDARARRSRTRQITALAGADLPAAELDGFVTLAEQLRPVFVRCEADDLDGAAAIINGLLRSYRSAPELSRHDDEPWHLHFHSADAGLAEGWAAGCVTGLAVVVGSGNADRLGVCTATPCDRVFIDTSRNGNRRFCSARCANRAAVSAFRSRQK